ncbi:MAG: dockerin type I repeat-containing protein, partial [Clostridia bacterium]|nr:dockerin type I repeat-containing protein [Clostridia bacterium]
MKKTICILLIVTFILTSFPVMTFSGGATAQSENTVGIVFDSADEAGAVMLNGGGASVLYGDVNSDGEVTIRDSIKLKRHIVDETVEIDETASDLNLDGLITSRDSRRLRLLLLEDEEMIAELNALFSTRVSAEFDTVECAAKATASSAGDLTATVAADEIAEGFDASDYRFAGIVYKAVTSSDSGAVYKNTDGAAKTEYTVYSDGEYHAKLFALDENEDWSGEVPSIAFDLISGAESGDEIYLDSFMMTSSIDALERFASERLQARRYPDLEVSGGSEGGDPDSFTLVFNNADTLSDLSTPNHTKYSFNKYATCLELEVDTGKIDPYIFLDLSSYGLSADEYRYITYVYKTRNASQYERKGELFLCAGNIAVPTGGCSYQFGLSQDGNLYAVTIDGAALRDSSNRAYWNGDIHGIRFDYFQDATVGESVFVKGVVLSKTQSAASAASALMTGQATVGAMNAKESIDYMYKVYSKDTSGTAYIEDVGDDHVFTFTGGTVDRFTKEHLEGRLSKFMAKNVGTEPEVEILDGYDELYASYAATELSEGYVTYKVQVGDGFYVLFKKTVYNMQKLILDHDLGPDCDDAAAVCIVVKAHMKGEINCLAITSCMYTSMSAVAAA